MSTRFDAIANLAEALRVGGRTSLRAVQFEEGWVVTVYHRGRVVDTPSVHPRERLEDAIVDALGDLQVSS